MNKGKLLKTARENAGLTQDQLAEKAGYSQSVISAWENNREEFSTVSWNKMKDLLDIKEITDQLPKDIIDNYQIYEAYGQVMKNAASRNIPPAAIEKIIEVLSTSAEEAKKQGR